MHEAGDGERAEDEGRASPAPRLLGLAAIVALIAVTSCLAFRTERAGEPGFWLLAGVPVLCLAPLALFRAWKDGELAGWMRPKAGDFTIGFLGAAVLFSCAYVFSKIVTANGSPRAIWLARLYLQLGDPNVLRAHSMGLLLALIAVAAAEEIVWRGLVTSLLAEVMGSRGAWAVGAVLYALAYVPTMWALAVPQGVNPVLPIAALGGGLVWGAMARRLGRLPPGIIAHALFDWCVVVMFRLWGESL